MFKLSEADESCGDTQGTDCIKTSSQKCLFTFWYIHGYLGKLSDLGFQIFQAHYPTLHRQIWYSTNIFSFFSHLYLHYIYITYIKLLLYMYMCI